MLTRCYIALGANLNSPEKQLDKAVTALTALAENGQVTVSSYYRSVPMGDVIQPDYVNAVAYFETALTPIELLDALQQIEQQQGRERLVRWGPRTLDLDVLLYGQQTIITDRLIVPHYGMKQRSFVLIPLEQISPELVLPCGRAIQQLISATMRDELEKIS
ncbi:2-amino-4-hydroxy-6-hydroxymethyldihydropteridine diphosphokinase [Shewanella maritima]|uniref:2-amino-4-hydroxy-6- hydroxymethyldihydropteridine diphosphokinase n=1 Tax=Shewanella maritima TaxID=2520507 RepID=UPI00373631DE